MDSAKSDKECYVSKLHDYSIHDVPHTCTALIVPIEETLTDSDFRLYAGYGLSLGQSKVALLGFTERLLPALLKSVYVSVAFPLK